MHVNPKNDLLLFVLLVCYIYTVCQGWVLVVDLCHHCLGCGPFKRLLWDSHPCRVRGKPVNMENLFTVFSGLINSDMGSRIHRLGEILSGKEPPVLTKGYLGPERINLPAREV